MFWKKKKTKEETQVAGETHNPLYRWIAGIASIIVLWGFLSHWEFSLDELFRWGRAAFQKMNAQSEIAAYDERNTALELMKGYVDSSAAFQVIQDDNDSLKVKLDSLGNPIRTLRILKNQKAALKTTDIVAETQFAIISLIDSDEIPIIGCYYAIVYKNFHFGEKKQLESGRDSTANNAITLDFPATIDPAAFTKASGWTKNGDNTAGQPGYNGCSGYSGSNEIWCPGSGLIEYTLYLDHNPPAKGIIQVSLQGSSEYHGVAPPSYTTDITLTINGHQIGTQTFPLDNGTGDVRYWKFDVSRLSGGANSITFTCAANGFVIYRSRSIKVEYFPSV